MTHYITLNLYICIINCIFRTFTVTVSCSVLINSEHLNYVLYSADVFISNVIFDLLSEINFE